MTAKDNEGNKGEVTDTTKATIYCRDYKRVGLQTWCNGYRRRMWTRRHEFKSWTILITFHIALIPLGKV